MSAAEQEAPVRILLILPFDRTYRYRKSAFSVAISYAPLTLITLAALVPPHLNAELTLCDEGVSPPVTAGDFDLVVITATASSSPRAYALCRYWRERGARTAMGGAHVTLQPDEAAQHADTVLIGAGELIWPRFLQDMADGHPQPRYQHRSERGFLPMPVPRRDLLPSRAYMNIATIIADRGCPLACEFCSVQHQWGRKGTARPVADVINEIKQSGRQRWIFLDPNLYADRQYSLELFRALIPLKIRWSGLATLNVTDDDEVFRAMCDSGCEGLLIGLENLSQQTMTATGKNCNQVSEYRRQIRRLRDNRIAALGCFVLGFDEDTPESIRDTIRQIPSLGLDLVRFSVLTPLPGTRLWQRMAENGRLITQDLSLYDNEHVVFQPQNMSPETLQSLLHEAWRETYRLTAILRRVLHRPGSRFIRLAANLGFRLYARRLRHEKSGLFNPAIVTNNTRKTD
ncbi:radical SAM protein [Morganella morganii subsp. morganii]|nr:radical SAM protein [Morganella morganii]MBT0332095.1 radical SAM protein [Morganella morganii subsp. morganii]HDS7248541.1 radical SAM protein [Morganella morganii subsp. morganii]